MVVHLLPKQETRVRFPHLAPPESLAHSEPLSGGIGPRKLRSELGLAVRTKFDIFQTLK